MFYGLSVKSVCFIVFKSSVSLLIFCFVVLSTLLLMKLNIIVELSVFPFSFESFASCVLRPGC